MSSVDSGDSDRFSGYDPQSPDPISSYVPGQLPQGSTAFEGAGSPAGQPAWDDAEQTTPPIQDDGGLSVGMLYALRGFAVIPFILAYLLLYDSVLSEPIPDRATVTKKTSSYRYRSGRSYTVHAVGDRKYSNSVSRTFHEKAQAGDTVRVTATPMLGVWTEATLLRGSRTLCKYLPNVGLSTCAFACVLVIIPAIAFAEPHIITRWKEMPKLILAIEAAGALGFIPFVTRIASLS